MDSRRHPLHRHAEARLVLFTGGEYLERSFDTTARFRAGDFVVRPAWFAHDGVPGQGSDYVRLPVSNAAWARHFSRFGWSSRRGSVDASALAELVADVRSGDALLETDTRPINEDAPAAALTDRLCAAMAAPSSQSLAQLAEEVRLKPWGLTRMFLDHHLVTPSRFRQEARAQRAVKLLAETCDGIGSIAQDAGFADQSHMTRAFRSLIGATPVEIRRQIRC